MTDLAEMARELADMVARTVAELPDRTSPDVDPEMMLVTHEELAAICVGWMSPALSSAHLAGQRSQQAENERLREELRKCYRPLTRGSAQTQITLIGYAQRQTAAVYDYKEPERFAFLRDALALVPLPPPPSLPSPEQSPGEEKSDG